MGSAWEWCKSNYACSGGCSVSVDSESFLGSFTYALVVDDLDDSGELLGVRTGAEEDDTADLDESPLAGFDVCVAHFDCVRWSFWRK